MRQLERVTAILKDTTESTAGRESLEALRDELAERILNSYRAPRERFALFYVWASALYGIGLLVAGVVWVFRAVGETFGEVELPIWVFFAIGGGLIIVGIFLLRSSFEALRDRQKFRDKWLSGPKPRTSEAPKL